MFMENEIERFHLIAIRPLQRRQANRQRVLVLNIFNKKYLGEIDSTVSISGFETKNMRNKFLRGEILKG